MRKGLQWTDVIAFTGLKIVGMPHLQWILGKLQCIPVNPTDSPLQNPDARESTDSPLQNPDAREC